MPWISTNTTDLCAGGPAMVNTDHLVAIRRGEDHIVQTKLENAGTHGTCEGVCADGSIVVLYCGPDLWRFMFGLTAVLGGATLLAEVKKCGSRAKRHYGQQ